jgi:hypothetical protein
MTMWFSKSFKSHYFFTPPIFFYQLYISYNSLLFLVEEKYYYKSLYCEYHPNIKRLIGKNSEYKALT